MTKNQCRSCGQPGLIPILSLGQTPLANSLLTTDQLARPEPRFPLDLAFCPHCTLVQIMESVPPKELFSNYLYFSSFSTTMLASAQEIATRLIARRRLNERSLAMEIASNDGYLLQYYRQAGIPVLGIEPAANIARVAEEERGIHTLVEFFGVDLAERLRAEGTSADVIHANNVLAHVPDLNGFIRGLRMVIKDDGLIVIEVPYVKPMFDQTEFDTIYHEHLCYFSLTALNGVFRRNGLMLTEVEPLPIHGGSVRLFVQREETVQDNTAGQALLAQEAAWGVDRLEFYTDFARRVGELRTGLTHLLTELKTDGKQIVAYGAAAKGNTLLNTFGIGPEMLDYVVDRSPHKQGLYLPGTHIPIYAPERIAQTRPDYVLILPWNIKDEIMQQMRHIREWGGRFIVPIPHVQVL